MKYRVLEKEINNEVLQEVFINETSIRKAKELAMEKAMNRYDDERWKHLPSVRDNDFYKKSICGRFILILSCTE